MAPRPWGVLGLAMDEPGTEAALDHGVSVARNEAGAVVEMEQVR